jgi:hypothetical protein
MSFEKGLCMVVAPTHEEVGSSLDRLIVIAKSDTGQARRVANFLLAWWDGSEWGHFPITDLFAVDAAIAADMASIFVYLSQHPGAIYATEWGRRDDMADLVERWRPEA